MKGHQLLPNVPLQKQFFQHQKRLWACRGKAQEFGSVLACIVRKVIEALTPRAHMPRVIIVPPLIIRLKAH